MAFLKIKIKLLSPVILSSQVPDNNLTATLDYIPATSILGIFASKYIFQEKLTEAHNNEVFYNWFLGDGLTFTNAYISEKEGLREIDFLPTPLCIKERKKDNKILNILLQDVDESIKSLASYVDFEGNIIRTKEPEKEISFHHKRDRLKGHTQDDKMFNYEALSPGQVFKGKIYGTEEDLRKFKNTFGEKISARLGKSKNTGYGRVEIELLSIKSIDREIIDKEKFEEQKTVFLTFLSPCILINKNGFAFPSLSNLHTYLEKIWGKASFNIEKYVISTTNIEKYIAVWKMKRPLEYAIATGSTLMLSFSDELSYEEVNKGLRQIVEKGLGERRNEGFGRVKVDIMEAKEYYRKEIKIDLKKPEGDMPEEVRKIFIRIIQNALEEEFKLKAYRSASEFNKLPTPSLLGKLNLMLFNTDADELKKCINNLRKTAQGQLKNCQNGKQTLFEHIKEFSVQDAVNNFYNENSDCDRLVQLVKYDVKNENEFLLKLWKIYFEALFKCMRKKKQFSEREVCFRG